MLLGPSRAAGRRIRMVSGLEEPDSGRIVISRGGLTLPPQERNVAMVFQRTLSIPIVPFEGTSTIPASSNLDGGAPATRRSDGGAT